MFLKSPQGVARHNHPHHSQIGLRSGMAATFAPISGLIIPAMGLIDTAVADALFTHGQQKVLGLLFGQPDRQFYVNEMLRLTGAGKGALHRELARLEAAGLVCVTRLGNQKRYQANRAAPIFDELRGIVLKTFGLATVLRACLAPLADAVQAAFVYGSMAQGADRADSDVDVFVVSATLGYGEVLAVLEPAEGQLWRKINPVIYTPADVRKRRDEGNAFVTRVLAGGKIWLMGGEGDLG